MKIKEVYVLKNRAGIVLPKWIEELYSKKDSPYFFTKLYNGDEFMLVDISDLTIDDVPPRFKRYLEKYLLKRKLEPNDIRGLNKKSYFFMSSVEASFRDNSMIEEQPVLQFIKGCDPIHDITFEKWNALAKDYLKGISQLADISDYFLLILRMLKDNLIKEDEIDSNSSRLGNLLDGKNPSKSIEKTGEREFYGMSIFGNTSKTVKNSYCHRFKYAQMGADAFSYGKSRPLGYATNFYLDWIPSLQSNGLIVLRP